MKVISVTPAGRKIYLEILVPYLLKNRAYIAEHHFWLNTENREDIGGSFLGGPERQVFQPFRGNIHSHHFSAAARETESYAP